MTRISKTPKHLLILPLCAAFFFIGTFTVQAATYYVATTGSDSNPGTSGSPWRNPQKCTTPPVVAGDTCTVADGTYTDPDGNGIVVYASASSSSGTISAPITIKSTNPHGAIITVPGISGLNAGFYLSKPYYIIEGFQITGGTGIGASASNIGIYFAASSTGGIARQNSIHDIARTICSNSDFGNAGSFMEGASNVILEKNTMYAIGRLRNGESGCVTTHYQHDHGVYVKGMTNTIIRYNVIYDTNRGWPIHVFGGTTTSLSVYNNTLVGGSPTGLPVGQILLASTVTTANIKNNISYAAIGGMINYYSPTASGVTVSFNLCDASEKTGTYAGVAFSNNLQNTSPGFLDAARNDFHLSSGSAAINAGTNVGFPVPDGAPDIGAYEFGISTTLLPPQNVRVQ